MLLDFRTLPLAAGNLLTNDERGEYLELFEEEYIRFGKRHSEFTAATAAAAQGEQGEQQDGAAMVLDDEEATSQHALAEQLDIHGDSDGPEGSDASPLALCDLVICLPADA